MEIFMKKQIITILISMTCIIGIAIAVTGCNTMAGVGQDISAGGKALSKGADNTKSDMSS